MQAFNRSSGPIGSNSVMPLHTTGSGMTVAAANKAVAPEQEALDFKGYFKVENVPHNSVIYKPGDSADRAFLLKAGRVHLVRVGKNGMRSVTAILRVGDLFGELFRPEGTTLEEMAVAAGEAEVWSIDGRDFRAQLEARPALASEVVRAGLRTLDREEREYEAKLEALRAAIDKGDASGIAKGNVLTTAQIAGVMAAKRTHELAHRLAGHDRGDFPFDLAEHFRGPQR